MSTPPGWYKDPVDRTVQRYWDGEGWVGPSLPADATPPTSPPPEAPPHPDPAPAGGAPTSAARTEKPAPTGAARTEKPAPTGAARTEKPAPGGAAWTEERRERSDQSDEGRQHRPGPAPAEAGASITAPAPAQAGASITAPPMPHGLPLASPGDRIVARLIDIAAVAGLALLANAWFLFQLGREFLQLYREVLNNAQQVSPEVSGRINTLAFVITLVTAAVWLAYEVPALANTGQTLGKRVLGIKVIRLDDDGRLGFGRALRRWWTLGLPTLAWTCCIGFVLQFVDCLFVAIDRPLHQALHDKGANTVVVFIGRPTSTKPGGKS